MLQYGNYLADDSHWAVYSSVDSPIVFDAWYYSKEEFDTLHPELKFKKFQIQKDIEKSPAKSNKSVQSKTINRRNAPTKPDKMCRNLQKCRMKDCQFAHSLDEFKPRQCTFGKKCRAGEKCRFIHTKESKQDYLSRLEQIPKRR